MKLLITGTAGFIGHHLLNAMVELPGIEIVGLDCINDYYDIQLKYDRLGLQGIEASNGMPENTLIPSSKWSNYSFTRMRLEDAENISKLFRDQGFTHVCNLAAQAGVRYSLENPHAYMSSNIDGFLNILEGCRHNGIKHLAYASSSSVYGLNESMPFSVQDNVDHPISLYAASKKSNELMAHTYSHLFGLPTTGLRFFTVYGPWGRPDMALFLFTKAMLAGDPINVFNNGNMRRDFTFVADIVEGVKRIIQKPATSNPNWSGKNPEPGSSVAPYRVYNIGNNNPVELLDFIKAIETKLDIVAEKNFMPLQAGDVPETYADVQDLINDMGYRPQTDIETGISSFIDWYTEYYH